MPPSDPDHWLYRFAPREWLRAALAELQHARAAFARRNARAGLAGCRRAAGVAINGMLSIEGAPDARYGRSYMDHLAALAADARAPEAVRESALALLQAPLPGGEVVALRTATTDARALDAAETIMAHAYALVVRSEAGDSGG